PGWPRLEMPHPVSISGIETNDVLGEQMVARSCPAIPVVARRADGEINQAAAVVDAERRPHVRVPCAARGLGEPRFSTRVSRVPRHGTEAPDPLPGAHVERLHVTRWIV